jgi:hypothetical protein
MEKYWNPVKQDWHSAFPGLPTVNFCVNVLCGLIAYCHQPKKPTLRLFWSDAI